MPTLQFDVSDKSTKSSRRRTVALIIAWLCQISREENAYMMRIPDNLQGGPAYAAAQESIALLAIAIETLADVY